MNNQKSQEIERREMHDLIQFVRQGDQNAFSILLNKFEPLIESLVSKFCRDESYNGSGLSREDIRQEAVLKFYNAILSYDTEQSEVEFGLYSKICISNALVSQLRLHKKHTLEQATESINTVVFVHDSEDPSYRVLEDERVRSLYSVFRNNLSAFEYDVWCMYMAGRTAKEIGVKVNKSEKSVTNAIFRVRKKLRSLLS